MQVLPRAAGGAVAAVLGFTAHHVVAADVDPDWVRSVLPPGSLSAPLSARFVGALADRVGAEPGAVDVVLLAPAAGAVPVAGLQPAGPVGSAGPAGPAAGPAGPAWPGGSAGPVGWAGPAGSVGSVGSVGPWVESAGPGAESAGPGAESAGHPRVARAGRYRVDVRAYEVPGGVLVLGRGLAGRWEVAVEVDPAHRGRSLGRRLAAAAPALVPPGEPLWAQVAPGNVASLRAFLAAGYRPAGAEVLLA